MSGKNVQTNEIKRRTNGRKNSQWKTIIDFD